LNLQNKNNDKPVLLIDDQCAFCNKSTAFIVRNGGEDKMEFESLFKSEGKEYLKKTGLPENYTDSIVFIENGKAYLKSDAALRVSRYLKGIWPLLYIFVVVPRGIRDFFYSFIAKHRHKF
jgi:predicted DCC family thiol-disulfide oxidoreductase YuxK